MVREPWRAHPLAWIHRAEAAEIARELGVPLATLGEPALERRPILRLSDAEMLRVASELTRAGVAYCGPRAEVMQVCYDKLQATRLVAGEGIDCPKTALANSSGALDFPLVGKPRRGSDSLGVRLMRKGPLPERYRSAEFVVQEYVRGTEITIGLIGARIGRPLAIGLPRGTPYSFVRKYLFRPPRELLPDLRLAMQTREAAARIARLLAVNWAARIDFIAEPGGRLCFLECDVAPLVGRRSAFAASLAAGGIDRAEQLRLLVA
ncbi:MAG: ATP-grasp domain-containing protein [Betaproteobacteria bacterium]|nr:MAG: ATP-grasp domain-containing protein [Betaproteobacteria bacterium]